MLAQLDTKTVYTFMDSLINVRVYVKTAKEMGYRYIGIMDIDNLYAAYYFLRESKEEDMRAILGLETDLQVGDTVLNFRFIALGSKGYKNLVKISTKRMLGKTHFSDFSHLLEEIVPIIPYFPGVNSINLRCNFYIGVTINTPTGVVFAHPILPLHTVRYLKNDELETLHMLRAIRNNTTLQEIDKPDEGQILLPYKDLEQSFRGTFPEALKNLEFLVKDIHYEIDTSLKLPRFNPERPAVDELKERAQKGLEDKNLLSELYQERLDTELSVIHNMGFDDYFLIVWDLLRFGRSRQYYMGMGRGSVVGSLVAYVLDVTGIDPVKHNLLFERFLNLERYNMPDIDIDIPDIYRPEFIRYVRDRYGFMNVAQIVTYSTFGAKQAIRDVFKRFGLSEHELMGITGKIRFKDSLMTTFDRNFSFRQMINSKLEYKQAFEIAKKIEGNPRQTSTHAAGVVVSSDDLTDSVPLKSGEDVLVTQYDSHSIEDNGLLKIDLLGLRSLTFLQRMKEKVLKRHNVDIDIPKIDLEDPETLKLFSAGETRGIFQFEQTGAINLLRRIRPSCFEEIVATTSLNRPGASDYIDNFVNRKNGRENIDWLDDSLKGILEPTYGIMLYQEQVMQVAQKFGGFSLGRSDVLRQAMSKKNYKLIHNMESDFILGSLKLGHSKEKAKKIFRVMEKFSGYGFNRSHACAYAALAFQLAFFKTHYPDIFFDIMLNYSNASYIMDTLQFGFRAIPININDVPHHTVVRYGEVHIGLMSIKGMSKDFCHWIMSNRPFSSIEEFILKLPKTYRKGSLLISLIQAGLFDIFEKNRRKILKNLDNLFVFSDELSGLFSDTIYCWIESEDYTQTEKFNLEKEIFGVGISPHPLLSLLESSDMECLPIRDLRANSRATVLIEIQYLRVVRTKTGFNMAFLKVSDTQTQMDVILFPEVYKRFVRMIKEKRFYYVTGRVQQKDGSMQIIAENLSEVVTERFWVQLEDHRNDRSISNILTSFPGNIPVILRYEGTKETVSDPNFKVMKSTELQSRLKKLAMKTLYR